MQKLKILTAMLALILVMLSSAGCQVQGASTGTAVTPQPTVDPVGQHLKDLEFENFSGAIVGTIPPQMSSYRYDPTLALGAMFEKVLKTDALVNSCNSSHADDFELKRIVNVAPLAGCVAQSVEPNHKAEERIVQGGGEAKISHLVGEAGVKAKYAFEFLVTTPAAASYPGSQRCVDTAQVVLTPPSPRTCDVYFVTGATLTQVTYRQYQEVEANAKYNAMVTVEGKAYGSSSNMRSLLVLTVDFISLGGWFDHDPSGFVLQPTMPEAVAVVNEVENLLPDEFLEAAALPSADLFLLPDLSIQNLIDDPALELQVMPNP